MTTFFHVIGLVIAYLVGSIPSSVWIGRYFYGIDVREYGSGNAGATNTFRVLGKKAGIPVLLIDVFKGWISVNMAYLTDYRPGSEPFVNFQLVLGIAALLGHIFPVYAGFRGGKGIATLLGIILAVHPMAALISIAVFLVVLLVSRYVSLGSMVAAISFPILIIVFFKSPIPSLVIFSLVIAVLVLITHQKNIERLLRREESKTKLIKKKDPGGK
jgi:glycerol-3-phosphate acyltransferase PlsY